MQLLLKYTPVDKNKIRDDTMGDDSSLEDDKLAEQATAQLTSSSGGQDAFSDGRQCFGAKQCGAQQHKTERSVLPRIEVTFI